MSTENANIKAWARIGAAERVKGLELELQQIYAVFPDIFPAGMPVITRAEYKKNGSRSRAESLIVGAEAMRRSRNGDAALRSHDLPAKDGEQRVSVTEGAKMLGISTASIYSYIKRKKLRIADTKGPKHAARVRLGDLRRVAQVPAPQQETLNAEPVQQPAVEQPVEQPVERSAAPEPGPVEHAEVETV